MKTTLITALSLMMAGAAVTQAQTLTFDSQASFTDHFTRHNGGFTYSSSKGGLEPPAIIVTSLATLGNAGYNPGGFLTETISATFSMDSYFKDTSMGLYARTDSSMPYSTMTGILGLVNIDGPSKVRLRLFAGAVYTAGTNFADLTVNLTTPLTATQKFIFSLEQQNISVGDDLQAQFRLVLTDESGSVIYGDTNWRNVSGLNNYIDEGAAGLRVYQNPGTAGVVIYDFAPVPVAIPEPSTVALLGVGLAFGAWMRRRQTGRRA